MIKGLNLSKMKKVSSDGQSSVFQHPEGHTIRILHSALPALQRKQLERLPVQPVKMAEGGFPDVGPAPVPSGNDVFDKAQAEAYNDKYMAAKAAQDQDAAKAQQDQADRQAYLEKQNASNPTLSPEPVAAPAQMSADQPAAPQVPSNTSGSALPAGPQSGQSPVASNIDLNSAYQQGVTGIKQQAQVEADLAKQRADIEGSNIDSQKALMYNAQQNAQDFQIHHQQLIQDYMNNKINPNAYLENMGTGQKVATAIGLFLGGLGSHGGNPAMDFINKQIDRDIEGQQSRIGQQKTLLEANQSLYHDQLLANNATKIDLNNIYSHQISQAADQLGTPAALAKKNQALSQFALQNQALLQQNARRAAVLHPDPGQQIPLSAKIQYGLPQDQQAEAQKQASEYDSYLRTKQNVNALYDQLDKEQSTGNLVNPQSYSRVNQIKAQIVQAIMETSPSKRLTKESIEAEIKPLEYGTGATQQTRDAARQAINKLVDVHAGPMNILQDNGFIPKVGSNNPMSKDQQALAWANANPKDPRAMQIKQQLSR